MCRKESEQCNMKGWSNKGTVFERPRMYFYNLKWTFACKLLHVQVEFAGTWSFAVADLRWARGTPPPVQILSISCSFCKILAKSYVAPPPTPRELASPPRVNPGSATALLIMESRNSARVGRVVGV